jgi:hypothetical protein
LNAGPERFRSRVRLRQPDRSTAFVHNPTCNGHPARTHSYSERADASLISLSLRHFPQILLIEVYDTDSNPPILCDSGTDAENGRGLILIDALAREWSYFFSPDGDKVVYCVPEIT